LLTLLLLAVSVGLSNFAGALAIGVPGIAPGLRWRVGLLFGVFEAGMPIVGLVIGQRLAAGLDGATRWVGAAILVAVGVYSLTEALRGRGRERPAAGPGKPAQQRTARLMLSALALSLDNLAIGFALGALGALGAGAAGILLSALTIGSVSVAMSLAGLELGARMGALAGRRSEFFGAVILITVAAGVGTGVI
jgi:putative Mn2+ efflux pump MntP